MVRRVSRRRTQTHAGRWVALIAGSAVIGCGEGTVDQVALALGNAGSADIGMVVALDTVAPGQWKRMLLFGPYTQPEQIAQCLGIRSARRLTRNIESLDNMNLLVVETSAGKYRSKALMRGEVDFSASATGAGYTPSAASFAAVRTDGGGVQLNPVGRPSMRCWARDHIPEADSTASR